jgi:hypothetical protein
MSTSLPRKLFYPPLSHPANSSIRSLLLIRIADMQGDEANQSTRPSRKKFDFITSTSGLLNGNEDEPAPIPEQMGEVSDHLPSALFVSSNMMTNQAMIPVQPIALKTAMKYVCPSSLFALCITLTLFTLGNSNGRWTSR